MASTFTPNKNLEKAANGDYVDDWNVPVNADFTTIDTAFGGATSLNVTSVSGNVTLTGNQTTPPLLKIGGNLTANVTYIIPGNVGGFWCAQNAAVGNGTLTIASGGGGTSVTVATGTSIMINSDGTNIAPSVTYVPIGNITVNNSNWSGTPLSVANGGTGSGNQSAAQSALGVPSATGTGASGTWSINISGTAATATSATSASTATSATTAGTATTANALNTSNSYQVSALGVGTGAGSAGSILATGNITAFFSDDRLKTRLGYIDHALDKVMSLRGFYWEPNETAIKLGYEQSRNVGISAQDLQAVLPEAVTAAPIDPRYLAVNHDRMTPLLIEAIKELAIIVADLRAR